MSLFARIYPGAGRAFAPWKNGGGETAEILCVPQGAGFYASYEHPVYAINHTISFYQDKAPVS